MCEILSIDPAVEAGFSVPDFQDTEQSLSWEASVILALEFIENGLSLSEAKLQAELFTSGNNL